MRKLLLLFLAVLLTVGLTHWSTVQAQNRNVTFIVNTATVPDTLPVSSSAVQIRGSAPLTWGDTVTNNTTRIGGDYWTKTLSLPVGSVLRYKLVIRYASGTGWENDLAPADTGLTGGDRSYRVADKDTVLQVQFWNNGASGRPQYFRPWTTVTDTFMNVYFRVNMLGPMSSGTFGFNNNVDTVGVRGGGPAGGDLNWSPTFYLTKEANASNGDGYTVPANSFWSGRVRIPKSGVTDGQEVEYKYLIGYDWGRDELGGQPNRKFMVPVGKKDTTISWVFFNNERPASRVNNDTVRVTFRADLSRAVTTGGFTIGDTLQVRYGYFATANALAIPKVTRMLRQGLSNIYQVVDTIVTDISNTLDYQYYVVKLGQDVRENYYNFFYTGPIQSEAERRQLIVPSGTFTIADTGTSITVARRQPVFPNNRVLARNVNVRWEVDVRPAIYQVASGDTLTDIQGTFHITRADSILPYGVWMNGPAVGGWSNPGGDWGLPLQNNLDKKLYDDGTNGDVSAGDSIFTRMVLASPDSIAFGSKGRVGQTFKFGIRGGDNEGGRGGFGNNHLENIDDSGPTYTLRSQWGSINPAFYDRWDYDRGRPTSVDESSEIPNAFALRQNYPNPFNPSTKIEYTIPTKSPVILKVYNLLGQEVSTLVNEVQTPGKHAVIFNSAQLGTGVYFYRITAGDFVSTRKMLLLK